MAEDPELAYHRLVSEAKALMRSRGLRPGYVRDIADHDGYRIAFGYLTQQHGGGAKVTYLQIRLTDEEFANPTPDVRQQLLAQLAAEIDQALAA